MLKRHIELANTLGLKQGENEGEFDFRKRLFTEVYQEDAMEAMEILFCIEDYRELMQSDRSYILMARDAYNSGKLGFQKFLKGFGIDPAMRYQNKE